MLQVRKLLLEEISKLPIEKIGKVLSFVRYLDQEPETELFLDPSEDNELDALYKSGDFVDASEIEEKIKAMPND
jgi:hypothetical protein